MSDAIVSAGALERPRGPGGKRKNQAQRDAEAVHAFEMRAAGRSTWEIARELNVSVQTACKRIDAARKVLVPSKVEEARELSMRVLEVARAKLLEDWARLQKSADQANRPGMGKIEHSPKFAEAIVKIEAQMDKLQGLAKPVLIEATVTVVDENSIDAETRRLAEMLGLNDDLGQPAADEPRGDERIDA